ncbi:hypothetical protein FHR50_002553 [Xanthomonas arboricola]
MPVIALAGEGTASVRGVAFCVAPRFRPAAVHMGAMGHVAQCLAGAFERTASRLIEMQRGLPGNTCRHMPINVRFIDAVQPMIGTALTASRQDWRGGFHPAHAAAGRSAVCVTHCSR